MRMTIRLDEDVAAAVDRLRRIEGIGVSEAVNRIARAGLTVKPMRKPYKQRTFDIGVRIDVSNVAEALEIAEGPLHR
jgi:metal-responsive CopG/Arc/MetJ family transcriptional regulator